MLPFRFFMSHSNYFTFAVLIGLATTITSCSRDEVYSTSEKSRVSLSLRHFGIEPKLYDLVVVKANTSFRVPYGAFAGEICFADTPGVGAANLKRFHWEKLPKNFYPFDLAEEYRPTPATIR